MNFIYILTFLTLQLRIFFVLDLLLDYWITLLAHYNTVTAAHTNYLSLTNVIHVLKSASSGSSGITWMRVVNYYRFCQYNVLRCVSMQGGSVMHPQNAYMCSLNGRCCRLHRCRRLH